MDNYIIADQLSLLSKLMDIHGENSFKSKSYSSAAFSLEKLPQSITSLSPDAIFKIRGIGESVGTKIIEIITTGELTQLKEYLSKTPAGVLEMMSIKGLGPKKINALWKELNISTIEDLKKACEENRVATQKGFGEKTQTTILESIAFLQQNTGKFLYATIEAFASAFTARLKENFPSHLFAQTGTFRRQAEINESLDWVTNVSAIELKNYLLKDTFELVEEGNNILTVTADNTLLLRFFITTEQNFYTTLFETSCSPEFLEEWNQRFQKTEAPSGEEEIFGLAHIPYIPPFLRERKEIIGKPIPDLIQTNDVKGLIHAHSNWSDGAHSIEEMANELIDLGFEYLVLSDHSKSAYYANGLSELRIKEQHRYIDELNKKLSPFKIFKSIECDILNDGTLDYDDKTLASFDLVITSIHSNLDMDVEKAMKRLLGAITNRYTTILGHLTGRLLLKRKGYPVDHKTIIDACASHNVVIEINANPNRLDMDWHWIEYAMEKKVLLSINPDAHTKDEFQNIKYGVLTAQKGGLPTQKNLSSYSLNQFEAFLDQTRKARGF